MQELHKKRSIRAVVAHRCLLIIIRLSSYGLSQNFFPSMSLHFEDLKAFLPTSDIWRDFQFSGQKKKKIFLLLSLCQSLIDSITFMAQLLQMLLEQKDFYNTSPSLMFACPLYLTQINFCGRCLDKFLLQPLSFLIQH